MKKNVAGQKIGAQMVSATDGSAFTGAVTVYVTVDAGVQAAGSVGAGACTHEGQGYHTYAPSDAETNGDLVAFTFTGAGAVPATVQVFTGYPQTGDSYARLGSPAGASVSADIAAIEAQTDDIGVAGAGLTALGDVRLANLDAAISTIPTAAEIDTQLSGTHGAGAWGAGTGASSKTYTVTDTGTGLPLAGVYCRLTTDVSGLVQVDAGTTTAAGQVIFHHDLAAGTTVYVWRSKTGYEFTDPDTETI